MPTLLIVDDHASVRFTLEYVFGMHYRVLTAPSGAAAVEMVRANLVNAALVDLHMPGMDGFQTCEAIQACAKETGRTIPVWLMTAAFSLEAKKHASEVGARALLNKPFDHVAFLAELDKHFAPPPMTAAESVA
jgi:CheY-like chemotaxis protein